MYGKVSRDIVNGEVFVFCKGSLNYEKMMILRGYILSNLESKLILDLTELEKINISIAKIIFNALIKRGKGLLLIKSNKIVHKFLLLIGMDKFLTIIRTDSFSHCVTK